MSGSDTWGIDGATFLALYAVGALATLIVIWLVRRALIDNGDGGRGTPSLDAYELALLNGGPELAITTAAAKLHADGALASQGRTIVAVARPADAGDLEHEVYSAVERSGGMPPKQLRRRLAECASVRVMRARLTGAGLLLDDRRRALVDATWVLTLPLLALGVARIIAGAQNGKDIGLILFATACAGFWAVHIARRRHWASAHGTGVLDAQRSERAGLKSRASGAELPLAVALFGAGVLWLAAPEIASAYAIPRDGGAGSPGSSGDSGGGCGGGCGG